MLRREDSIPTIVKFGIEYIVGSPLHANLSLVGNEVKECGYGSPSLKHVVKVI